MIVLQAVSFDTYIGTERFGTLTDDFLQGVLIECQYAMDYLGFLGSMSVSYTHLLGFGLPPGKWYLYKDNG